MFLYFSVVKHNFEKSYLHYFEKNMFIISAFADAVACCVWITANFFTFFFGGAIVYIFIFFSSYPHTASGAWKAYVDHYWEIDSTYFLYGTILTILMNICLLFCCCCCGLHKLCFSRLSSSSKPHDHLPV